MISGSNSVTQQEVVASNPASFSGRGFYSGGGFSNVFGTPSYQQEAVNNFFKNHDPEYLYYETTGGFNASTALGRYNVSPPRRGISSTDINQRIGRGYPDVSANGGPIPTYSNGKPYVQNGTSAAVPIWASILTRINEARLAANKSTVGFVNPTLYSNTQVLNDITEGYGYGCNTTGFSAAEGWDPITGLGTPRFGDLMDLFMGMP